MEKNNYSMKCHRCGTLLTYNSTKMRNDPVETRLYYCWHCDDYQEFEIDIHKLKILNVKTK